MSLLQKKRMHAMEEGVAALDVGSSKTCCAMVDTQGSSEKGQGLRLIGVGQHISKGIKNGRIVDMEALEDSILNAIHSAEKAAGRNISAIYVGIPASCLKSYVMQAEVVVGGIPVDEVHIRRLMTSDSLKDPLKDREFIHILPLSYTLDQTKGIKDPRGMVGEVLKVDLQVLTAPSTVLQNFTNCLAQCHLDVAGFVATPYATGLATLVPDELELGVTLIDMGGGSTSISCFLEGSLVHLDEISLGGQHITNDIARGLSTPITQAERLKTLYGNLVASGLEDRETITVPQLGEDTFPHTHQVPKALLTDIIRARIEEILGHVWHRLHKQGMGSLLCQRLVFTGGASQMAGLVELASTKWGRQIRLASPIGVKGQPDSTRTPMFSTCAGILRYALQDQENMQRGGSGFSMRPQNTWQGLVSWVRENF